MLDAATMCGLALHGRDAEAQLMLDAYSDPAEREELIAALVQCAVAGILSVAVVRGVSPDTALAALIRQIHDMP